MSILHYTLCFIICTKYLAAENVESNIMKVARTFLNPNSIYQPIHKESVRDRIEHLQGVTEIFLDRLCPLVRGE